MNLWIKILVYLGLNTSALVLLKQGVSTFEAKFLATNASILLNVSLRIVIGGIFYICSFLVWIWLMKDNDLTIIYPVVTGLSFVAISIMAYFLLDETLPYIRIVGMALILLGVVFIVKK